MLWQAGQERTARESHDRLAELFVTARDAALEVLVNTGQVKPKGAWRRPSYLASVEQPVRSPAARDAALAELGAIIPGMVRRMDS